MAPALACGKENERGKEASMSGRKTRAWIVGGALAVALISGGTAIAVAGGGDDDKPLRGSNLEKATTAALEHTGGGTVIETEVGDDGAAYGVEIRRDDGSVVEVSLDAEFNVIGDEADDDGPNDQEGPSDD
jgi:uncharacterized membrane protein YkoI